jgi:hypothetical protein
MNGLEALNEQVEVITSFYKQGLAMQRCFPAKMRYHGHDIIFTELCLRHPTTHGKRMVHIFDMSDGVNDYRLEFDAESLIWTLMTLLEGHDDARA